MVGWRVVDGGVVGWRVMIVHIHFLWAVLLSLAGLWLPIEGCCVSNSCVAFSHIKRQAHASMRGYYHLQNKRTVLPCAQPTTPCTAARGCGFGGACATQTPVERAVNVGDAHSARPVGYVVPKVCVKGRCGHTCRHTMGNLGVH